MKKEGECDSRVTVLRIVMLACIVKEAAKLRVNCVSRCRFKSSIIKKS